MRARLRPLALWGLAAGLLLGVIISVALPGWATRNSSGVYTLPAGNPVVPGTPISSSWANNTLGDIANELTDSLSRSGKGAMQQPLQLSTGSIGAPGLTFSGDTDTGFYHPAANAVTLSLGAGNSQAWTTTGTTIAGTLGVTGATTLSTLGVTGATTLSTLGVTGATSLDGNFTVDTSTFHVDAANNRVGVNTATPAFPFETRGTPSGDGLARFGTLAPLIVRTDFGTTGIGFNAYYDGTNTVRVSAGSASEMYLEPGSGNIVIRTAGNGAAGPAAFTERIAVGPSGVRIGETGTAISGSYGATFALDFPNVNPGQCEVLFPSLNGVGIGGVCSVSLDIGVSGSGTILICNIASPNQVGVSFCNISGAAVNPGSLNYRVRVWQP